MKPEGFSISIATCYRTSATQKCPSPNPQQQRLNLHIQFSILQHCILQSKQSTKLVRFESFDRALPVSGVARRLLGANYFAFCGGRWLVCYVTFCGCGGFVSGVGWGGGLRSRLMMRMTFPAVIPAPPTPAMARPMMKATELGAAPQSADPISKMTTLAM